MAAKQCGFGFAAVLITSLVASPAAAQLCVGVPLGIGQTSLALTADLPDGANIFGAKVARSISSPLVVGAHYALTSYDDSVLEDATAHTVGANVAAELAPASLADAGVGFCPVAGVSGTFADGSTTIQVPLGVAFGAAFSVDDGIAVAPFVVPQFVWSRTSFDVGDLTVTDSDFGLNGGVNLVVSNLYFGALIKRSFADNAKNVFGLQAGLVF